MIQIAALWAVAVARDAALGVDMKLNFDFWSLVWILTFVSIMAVSKSIIFLIMAALICNLSFHSLCDVIQ